MMKERRNIRMPIPTVVMGALAKSTGERAGFSASDGKMELRKKEMQSGEKRD